MTLSLNTFFMSITKASFDKTTGNMLWASTASDVSLDSYGERMSVDLFHDFEKRVSTQESVPDKYKSTAWQGGNPYLSVSHYSDLGGDGMAGMSNALYVDGNRLKAKGVCFDTPLGRASFKAICKSVSSKDEAFPVRVSIGFLDYGHVHRYSDGTEIVFSRNNVDTDVCPNCLSQDGSTKIYTKGQLIHLALTRVPANKCTDIVPDVEVHKSMTSQLEDAESIVGKDLAEELETASVVVSKSDVLVEKSDADAVVQDFVAKPKDKNTDDNDAVDDSDEDSTDDVEDEKSKNKKSSSKEKSDYVVLESLLREIIEKVSTDRIDVVSVPHPLDEAIVSLKSSYDSSSVIENADDRLRVIQEKMDMLGRVIIDSVRTVCEPSVLSDAPLDALDVEKVIEKSIADALRPLTEKMALLTQQIASVQGVQVVRESVPQRRSVLPVSQPNSVQKSAVKTSDTPKLHDIIARSVGL